MSEPAWVALGATPAAPGAGTELAYAEKTTATSITATTEGTAQQIVAAPATTFDGTAVLIAFFAPYANPHNNPAGVTLIFVLYQDGAAIGQLGNIQPSAGAGGAYLTAPINLWRRMTPTAGSHTYSIRAYTASGTGGVGGDTGGAGKQVPACIRITKV